MLALLLPDCLMELAGTESKETSERSKPFWEHLLSSNRLQEALQVPSFTEGLYQRKQGSTGRTTNQRTGWTRCYSDPKGWVGVGPKGQRCSNSKRCFSQNGITKLPWAPYMCTCACAHTQVCTQARACAHKLPNSPHSRRKPTQHMALPINLGDVGEEKKICSSTQSSRCLLSPPVPLTSRRFPLCPPLPNPKVPHPIAPMGITFLARIDSSLQSSGPTHLETWDRAEPR